MKGIILAGGSGTRLYPVTLGVSKQLVPVYDKPMIYYPLSVLMLAGIRDILIITKPQDQVQFQNLLGDGSQLGIHLTYATQEKPNGLAEAFIIGKDFIGHDSVCLVLGDNIFYGSGLSTLLQQSAKLTHGASVLGYQVTDPERFGVVSFNDQHEVVSIEEKPKHPKSNYAITGLYFYDHNVVDIAANMQPSSRGELEITDVNKWYLDHHELDVTLLGRGYAWLDTGTHDSLLAAASFISTIQCRQNLRIAAIEEVAYRMHYIDAQQLAALAHRFEKNDYGQYLLRILKEDGG
ncbi:glucose-1-phosphate thymidylyltransferase [Levilactobacillus koreensis JCM 16448]|uniref:Glucose-1-phosphate thymidylyltransferase n=1 Tax=Levilactobacillus koreensis TaxID=637971 RepID=A0AAC8UWR2_9LACO|nr:glucose-1-phosphate thymidylyltransferase RfbA [Levilactobacillus koreensis]AKP65327.1 glucose-1-phosphate thymidylyltransferase [Levilactobacillus koreensis]KRK86088.1 glucose-1-phosphate thymidylyltransferase [Levilactobacillus koreensis JCM 16448]